MDISPNGEMESMMPKTWHLFLVWGFKGGLLQIGELHRWSPWPTGGAGAHVAKTFPNKPSLLMTNILTNNSLTLTWQASCYISSNTQGRGHPDRSQNTSLAKALGLIQVDLDEEQYTMDLPTMFLLRSYVGGRHPLVVDGDRGEVVLEANLVGGAIRRKPTLLSVLWLTPTCLKNKSTTLDRKDPTPTRLQDMKLIDKIFGAH
eukprot:Gb_38862 [translate_table: standard]